MKWLYAATIKAVMFLTFDIDVFIFTYLDTTALRKAVSFIDLNSLGACIAEKSNKVTKTSLKVKTSRA